MSEGVVRAWRLPNGNLPRENGDRYVEFPGGYTHIELPDGARELVEPGALPKPDAGNPEHLRFAAWVARTISPSTATHLSLRADEIEAEHARASERDKLIEQAMTDSHDYQDTYISVIERLVDAGWRPRGEQ